MLGRAVLFFMVAMLASMPTLVKPTSTAEKASMLKKELSGMRTMFLKWGETTHEFVHEKAKAEQRALNPGERLQAHMGSEFMRAVTDALNDDALDLVVDDHFSLLEVGSSQARQGHFPVKKLADFVDNIRTHAHHLTKMHKKISAMHGTGAEASHVASALILAELKEGSKAGGDCSDIEIPPITDLTERNTKLEKLRDARKKECGKRKGAVACKVDGDLCIPDDEVRDATFDNMSPTKQRSLISALENFVKGVRKCWEKFKAFLLRLARRIARAFGKLYLGVGAVAQVAPVPGVGPMLQICYNAGEDLFGTEWIPDTSGVGKDSDDNMAVVVGRKSQVDGGRTPTPEDLKMDPKRGIDTTTEDIIEQEAADALDGEIQSLASGDRPEDLPDNVDSVASAVDKAEETEAGRTTGKTTEGLRDGVLSEMKSAVADQLLTNSATLWNEASVDDLARVCLNFGLLGVVPDISFQVSMKLPAIDALVSGVRDVLLPRRRQLILDTVEAQAEAQASSTASPTSAKFKLECEEGKGGAPQLPGATDVMENFIPTPPAENGGQSANRMRMIQLTVVSVIAQKLGAVKSLVKSAVQDSKEYDPEDSEGVDTDAVSAAFVGDPVEGQDEDSEHHDSGSCGNLAESIMLSFGVVPLASQIGVDVDLLDCRSMSIQSLKKQIWAEEVGGENIDENVADDSSFVARARRDDAEDLEQERDQRATQGTCAMGRHVRLLASIGVNIGAIVPALKFANKARGLMEKGKLVAGEQNPTLGQVRDALAYVGVAEPNDNVCVKAAWNAIEAGKDDLERLTDHDMATIEENPALDSVVKAHMETLAGKAKTGLAISAALRTITITNFLEYATTTSVEDMLSATSGGGLGMYLATSFGPLAGISGAICRVMKSASNMLSRYSRRLRKRSKCVTVCNPEVANFCGTLPNTSPKAICRKENVLIGKATHTCVKCKSGPQSSDLRSGLDLGQECFDNSDCDTDICHEVNLGETRGFYCLRDNIQPGYSCYTDGQCAGPHSICKSNEGIKRYCCTTVSGVSEWRYEEKGCRASTTCEDYVEQGQKFNDGVCSIEEDHEKWKLCRGEESQTADGVALGEIEFAGCPCYQYRDSCTDRYLQERYTTKRKNKKLSEFDRMGRLRSGECTCPKCHCPAGSQCVGYHKVGKLKYRGACSVIDPKKQVKLQQRFAENFGRVTQVDHLLSREEDLLENRLLRGQNDGEDRGRGNYRDRDRSRP